MRINTKFIAPCLLVAALLSSVAFGIVSAQTATMTDAQIAQIRTSCVSAINTLNQLHANDALLRVNQGQVYESMSTKLMSRFNSRVTSNHLDGKDLIAVSQNYDTASTTFRDDYMVYEVQLSSALAIDCSKEPVSFYDAVAAARIKRAQVHADVVSLNHYIDDYSTAVDSFEANFNNTNQANQ